jgi:hypothetical protein
MVGGRIVKGTIPDVKFDLATTHKTKKRIEIA